MSAVARSGRLLCMAALVVLFGCADLRNHERDAERLTGGRVALGRDAVQRYGCATCHTMPGVRGADALVGPPLTRMGARVYVAGELPNTPANMMRWLQDPRGVSPNTAMPDTGVTAEDARDIAAYLFSLQ
jgi:cytochrome c